MRKWAAVLVMTGRRNMTITTQRFFTLPVITLISLSFMLGMSEFVIVGILPDIARNLSVSQVTVGNLVSVFAVIYAPMTPIGSALSARFPRFATHVALTAVFLAGNLLSAFASNYPLLVISRVIVALVSGTIVSISMTYAPDVATERNRTKFIAWVFSGFSIASVAGVPVGTWVAGVAGWRWTFHLISLLTLALLMLMATTLPRNSHIMKIGFLPQFRLFFDRRIQLGTLDVVFGASASYVFYTYLAPILHREVRVPDKYLSIGLLLYGVAGLWSNIHGGKLADRGRGVEPLMRIRPLYVLQAVLLCSLAFAHAIPVLGAVVLFGLGMLMYIQNSSSQVLYMDVAASAHPGSMNLAASQNSMSFNIGIAIGSAVGGLVNDAVGLTWLGPTGALFALLAVGTTSMLRTCTPTDTSARAVAARR